MQQNNKTQSELKTGTIHKYFDRNILTLTMSNATKKNAINSVHDKFHRTLILSGFCLLKIAKI
ncbi:hypothetical protein LDX97_12605, partial [Acinetobacter baumannii]|nr:hypothetical protein [Acinetobacter baumannii]